MNENLYEMKFLEAAVPELKDYLLSNDIYWRLGVQPPPGMHPYPQFSLGWLLLYRKRVQGMDLTDADRKVLEEIAETEAQWRSNWAKKAEKEFSMRLKLWTNYVNELRDAPAANKSRYTFEVQRRTMLDLLSQEAKEIPDTERKLLDALDSALRGRLVQESFIQDPAYADQFPPGRFWYLYGKPRAE